MTGDCIVLLSLSIGAILFAWIMYRNAMRDQDGIRQFGIAITRAQGAYDFQLEQQPAGREDQP